jgi:SAM-dependent methyltransferase
VSPGFKREQLSARYDVASIDEDTWHSYSGDRTERFISHVLSTSESPSKLLLNAGCGVYRISVSHWHEIALDLFPTPLRMRSHAICASVEALPFKNNIFGGLVCVGEVLGYCDPAKTIQEFARVLMPKGILVCDFSSTQSFRYWLTKVYGRAADIVTQSYNGQPERTWAYHPEYIESLLESAGFEIHQCIGTHTWSALANRMGFSMKSAVRLQKRLDGIERPHRYADLMTIAAVRSESVK